MKNTNLTVLFIADAVVKIDTIFDFHYQSVEGSV